MIVHLEDIKEVLRKALERAHKFEWTGWGIPIYLHDSGKLEAAGWLSDSSWQPEMRELCRVSTWNCEDMGYEPEADYTMEDCISDAIELMLDHYIDKIEGNLRTAREMAEEPFTYVDAIALASIEITD